MKSTWMKWHKVDEKHLDERSPLNEGALREWMKWPKLG